MMARRTNGGAVENGRLAVRTGARSARNVCLRGSRCARHGPHRYSRALGHVTLVRRGDARVLLVPTELDLATHTRAGRDGKGARLDITGEHAAFQQLDARRA